jgi:hypothetical protein
MNYNVYWEGGCYRTLNRRDAAITGLKWIKEGRQVNAVLTWKNPATGEIEAHALPFGNAWKWTEQKWRTIVDSLKGGAS